MKDESSFAWFSRQIKIMLRSSASPFPHNIWELRHLLALVFRRNVRSVNINTVNRHNSESSLRECSTNWSVLVESIVTSLDLKDLVSRQHMYSICLRNLFVRNRKELAK